jgi:TolA-binding protein
MKNTFSDDLFFQTRLQARIAGELKGEALEELKAAIDKSPEAAEEARFSHRLAEVLRHEDKFQKSALLAAIIAEEGLPPTPDSTGKGFAKNFLKWTAAFLLIVGLSGVFLFKMLVNSEAKTYGALYEQHYAPLENVIVTPDKPAGLEGFDQGMAAYDRGDYAKAIELLSAYYQQSGDANAALFLGVSHLEQGNAKAAAEALQNGIGKLPQPALDACQWYLALAYLKTGDTSMAKGLLKTIQQDGIYGKQAADLLEKIGKLEEE